MHLQEMIKRSFFREKENSIGSEAQISINVWHQKML
jgi:hypothetical protein